MAPESLDRIVSAIVAAATAFVVVEAKHALPVIRRGRWRLAVALAVGMAGASMGALPGPTRHPARAQDPAPTITPTLTVTPTVTITPTATRTPAPTATATPTYEWAYLHVDAALRVQLCDELAPGGQGTMPPPLAGCTDVAPWREAPPVAQPGQQYILWPGPWRYRVYIDATPTPVPGWCEPRYIVVTATPTATDTPTPTPTADWIATAVVGTLTALAPTATGTPMATQPPEATPTAAVWRLTLFPLLQNRPVRR